MPWVQILSQNFVYYPLGIFTRYSCFLPIPLPSQCEISSSLKHSPAKSTTNNVEGGVRDHMTLCWCIHMYTFLPLQENGNFLSVIRCVFILADQAFSKSTRNTSNQTKNKIHIFYDGNNNNWNSCSIMTKVDRTLCANQ